MTPAKPPSQPEEVLLFEVVKCFQLSMGLVLISDLQANTHRVKPGDAVKLVRPDGTEIYTVVKAIPFHTIFQLLLPESISKSSIPAGTAVWLVREKRA